MSDILHSTLYILDSRLRGVGIRRWRFLSASVTTYVRQSRLRNAAMFQVQPRLGITVCCVHEMTDTHAHTTVLTVLLYDSILKR